MRISRALRPVVGAAVAATLGLALLPHAAAAQTVDEPRIQQGRPDAPPYETEMRRLSEILGAVHYLRALCGADEGQTWRSMMQELIDAESPSAERRARLIESFNRGYRGFEQSYRVCNDTAVWIAESYIEEGAEIAQRIASRYGE